MIPEAYWSFVGRWWWLLLIFTAGGVALGVYLQVTSRVEYSSRAYLEVRYVRNVDGGIAADGVVRVIATDRIARVEEANRLATELSSAAALSALTQELGLDQDAGNLQDLNGSGSVLSAPRVEVTGPANARFVDQPAFITLEARGGSPDSARRLADRAAEVFAQRANDAYQEELRTSTLRGIARAERVASELAKVLTDKRESLATHIDFTVTSEAAGTLLDEHSNLLNELILVLGEIRNEASAATVSTGVDTGKFDEAIIELRSKVAGLGAVWDQRLEAPLSVLYSVEAQPDYQLALVRQQVIQGLYRSYVEELTRLTSVGNGPDQVKIVSHGSQPERIRTLGLKREYLFGFSAIGGLFVGWVIANLAETVLVAVRRRKEQLDSGAN